MLEEQAVEGRVKGCALLEGGVLEEQIAEGASSYLKQALTSLRLPVPPVYARDCGQGVRVLKSKYVFGQVTICHAYVCAGSAQDCGGAGDPRARNGRPSGRPHC
eukprot:1142355-Pelagomonas_calceolata.AAC.7